MTISPVPVPHLTQEINAFILSSHTVPLPTPIVRLLGIECFEPCLLVSSRVGCTAANFKIIMNPQATAVTVALFCVTMWMDSFNNVFGLSQISQGYQNGGAFVLL